jgi:hypothetical protein
VSSIVGHFHRCGTCGRSWYVPCQSESCRGRQDCIGIFPTHLVSRADDAAEKLLRSAAFRSAIHWRERRLP